MSSALAAATLVSLPQVAQAATPVPPSVINFDDPWVYDPSFTGLYDPANPVPPDQQYRPALIWMESQAIADVMGTATPTSADIAAARSWGRDEVRGAMWNVLASVIKKPNRNALETSLYTWFAKHVQKQFIEVADNAVAEYEKYSGHTLAESVAGADPVPYSPDGTGYCTYRMPGSYAANYTGWTSPDCDAVGGLPGPNFLAPTVEFNDFVGIGTEQSVDSLAADVEQRTKGMALGAASAVTLAATAAAAGIAIPIATRFVQSGFASTRVVKAIAPHLARALYKPATKFIGPVTKAAAKLAAKGVGLVVSKIIIKAFLASVGVIIDFIITTVLTSIDLANQLELPQKLNKMRNDAVTKLPDVAAMADKDADYATLFSRFLLLVSDDGNLDCTDGDFVVRDHPWDIGCLNAPAPPAEIGSDPVWEITPEGQSAYISSTLPVTSPYYEQLVTRPSGKSWFVTRKVDPEDGTLQSTTQSLQLPFVSWADLPYHAARIWDATNGYRFIITPVGDESLPTECSTSTCVLSSLKLVDSTGRKVSARLVARPAAVAAAVSYLPQQQAGLVTTYTVLNPVPGLAYEFAFPCQFGVGRVLPCIPGCDIIINGLCEDYAHPTAYATGTSVSFDWRLLGAQTFTVTSSVPGVVGSSVTRTYPVTVSSPVNVIDFPQPSDVTYENSPSTGKKVVTLDAAASSLLPVTLTPTAPSVSVCSVSGKKVTLLSSGVCTLTATQPGDSFFDLNAVWGPAATVTRSFTVRRGEQSVVITRAPVQYSDILSPTDQVVDALSPDVTGSLTGCEAPPWLADTSRKVLMPAGTYPLQFCSGLAAASLDIRYAPSVNVAPEIATLAVIPTTPREVGVAEVAARLTQQADGSPGDLTKARVSFLLLGTGANAAQPPYVLENQFVAADGTVSASIPNVTPGTYIARAFMAQGSRYFAAADAAGLVTVGTASAPAVSQQPSAVSAALGASATFTAAATGLSTPTVVWSRSTDAGATWAPVPGATSPSLVIPAVTADLNGSLYRATFTNASGTAVTDAVTLTVVRPSTTTLVAPRRITYGSSAVLTGTVRAAVGDVAAGSTVVVLRRPAGSTTWSRLATPLVSAAGTWSLTVKPTRTTSYRAVYEGAPGLAGSESAAAALTVANRVIATVSDTTPKVLQRVLVAGSVGPARPGAKVYLQRYSGGRWANVASTTLSSTSKYSLSWRPKTSVDYRFRVLAPATPVTVSGTSRTFVLKVG